MKREKNCVNASVSHTCFKRGMRDDIHITRRITNNSLFGFFHAYSHEFIVDLLMHIQTRTGTTTLALQTNTSVGTQIRRSMRKLIYLVEEQSLMGNRHCLLNIGIIEYDQRRLASQLQCYTL